MKRRSFLSLCLGTPLVSAVSNNTRETVWKWPCMGSHFRCFFHEKPPALLEQKVKTLLKHLELTFSVHRPDSEALSLCRKANAQPSNPIPVSDELYELSKLAAKYTRLTHGHFDITFGSLTNYWRYCHAAGQVPAPQRVKLLKKRVGSDQLQFHHLAAGKAISFHPHADSLLLDYGGIAKGYAVDQVATLLKQHQLSEALIDLGGEIFAFGNRDRSLVLLDQNGKPYGEPIAVTHGAFSTSGDLYQSIQKEGIHRSHVLSHSFADGLREKLSITVKAQNATLADTLSTAAHAAYGTPDFSSIVKLCDEHWIT